MGVDVRIVSYLKPAGERVAYSKHCPGPVNVIITVGGQHPDPLPHLVHGKAQTQGGRTWL